MTTRYKRPATYENLRMYLPGLYVIVAWLVIEHIVKASEPGHDSRYSVLQSTTPSPYYKVYYSSTTPYYKVLLERRQNDVLPVLLQYYKVLQSATPVLLRTTKYYSSTTPYYKVRNTVHPVLLRTTKYYKVRNDVHPVLLRTTKYYSSATKYYSVLRQYYKSLQNVRFVRGFRNFASNKLPKRAFRARLPQLFKEEASKTSVSCEASATFQRRSFQSLTPATQNAKMTSHLES